MWTKWNWNCMHPYWERKRFFANSDSLNDMFCFSFNMIFLFKNRWKVDIFPTFFSSFSFFFSLQTNTGTRESSLLRPDLTSAKWKTAEFSSPPSLLPPTIRTTTEFDQNAVQLTPTEWIHGLPSSLLGPYLKPNQLLDEQWWMNRWRWEESALYFGICYLSLYLYVSVFVYALRCCSLE